MRLQLLLQQRLLSFRQDHLMQQLPQPLLQCLGRSCLQLKTRSVTHGDTLLLSFPPPYSWVGFKLSHCTTELVSMRQLPSKCTVTHCMDH